MAVFFLSAKNLLEGEEGATMVEYGLLLALIALVCVAAVTVLGTNARNFFLNFASSM